MLTTTGLFAGGIAAVLGLSAYGINDIKDWERDKTNYRRANQLSYDILNELDKAGFSNYDFAKVYNNLFNGGYISSEDYKKGIAVYEKFKNDGASFNAYKALTAKEQNTLNETINNLLEQVPNLKKAVDITLQKYDDGVKAGISSSFPAISEAPSVSDVATPGYEADFTPDLDEVEPVKWWTGQELADLHNIDFNPDNYYDLIKQGTSANVDLARYQSAQMNEAADINNTDAVTSYLDALRNNKAESISKGATLGAKMANDLLANTDTYNTYATNQNTLAQDRLELMSNPLLEDAQARVAARDYFTKLAEGLGTDSTSLYYNDSLRYGQDWMNAATKYAADQSLRGQRAYANGQMYANYLQAQADVNAARALINSKYNTAYAGQQDAMNDYWLTYQAYKAKYANDPQSAFDNWTNYLASGYSGYKTPVDYTYALYKDSQS